MKPAKKTDVQMLNGEFWSFDSFHEDQCDGWDNGPTGHGDDCYSDADPGM